MKGYLRNQFLIHVLVITKHLLLHHCNNTSVAHTTIIITLVGLSCSLAPYNSITT